MASLELQPTLAAAILRPAADHLPELPHGTRARWAGRGRRPRRHHRLAPLARRQYRRSVLLRFDRATAAHPGFPGPATPSDRYLRPAACRFGTFPGGARRRADGHADLAPAGRDGHGAGAGAEHRARSLADT